MRVVGLILFWVGGLAVLLIDILASIWLMNEHGIGWAFAAWIFFIPLVVIPFLAGLGIPFVIAGGVSLIGQWLADEFD